MTSFNIKPNPESDLMDQFLSDESSQNPFHLKLSLGRSISAPPPGFMNGLTSSTPEGGKDEQNKMIGTKEYYYYYHSIKPHDPRLPLPTWQPTAFDQYNQAHQNDSDHFDDNNLSSQFDHSVGMSADGDSETHGYSTKSQASNSNYSQKKQYYDNQQNRTPYAHNGKKGYQGHNQPFNNNYRQQKGDKQKNNQYYDQKGNYRSGNNMYNNNPSYMAQQGYYGNSYPDQTFPYVDPNMTYPYYYNMSSMPMGNPMYMNQNYYMNNYQQNPQFSTPFPNYQGGGSYNQRKNFQGKKKEEGFQNSHLPISTLSDEELCSSCKDQNGSRLIQQYFEEANDIERDSVFQKLKPELYNLMLDVFGNYVVQKLLDLGSQNQKLSIFEIAQGKMSLLSQNTYSCRIVQKIIDKLGNNLEVQDSFLSEIKGDVLPLIADANGNHVIQKCFDIFPIHKLQFIIDEVALKVEKLAFHSYGCRVIQKILECTPRERLNKLYENLMISAPACCMCQFGNYIMQFILEKGPQPEKEILLNILKKNFVKYSLNKFASNVIEKSLVNGSQQYINDVIQVLTKTDYNNKPGLIALLTHDFGNYVVQTLFENCDDFGKQQIYDKVIQEKETDIKKNQYGKYVLTFIKTWAENQAS